MPSKTLQAAALTLIMSAWSIQPAHPAERPARGQAATAKKSGTLLKLFTPFSRLKQVGGVKDGASQATTAGYETAAAAKSAAGDAKVRARTAAYNDEEPPVPGEKVEAPAVEAPAALPAPAPLPATPITAAPVGAYPAPAYAPLRGPGGYPAYTVTPGYPNLNAPMNPVPVPHVPYQVGSTIITNQAFYPHEMLYPHKYRAMYPPYYYKVHGGWAVTPWGVWSSDHWELQGTEVKVNYRSRYSLFSGFTPPGPR